MPFACFACRRCAPEVICACTCADCLRGGQHHEAGETDGRQCCRTWEDCETLPVRTQCGHLLCEQCALSHNSKSGRCPVCEKPLKGVFNAADDVIKKFGLSAKAPTTKADVAGAGGWEEAEEDAGGWS